MKIITPNNRLRVAISAALLATAATATAQSDSRNHDYQSIEEIIVSSPFAGTAAETALPIGVLSGEELREKVANTLGETLRNEIGINNASFGPGLGHPVIRGQSGNRVNILMNSVGVTDASNQSPDHAEGVEVAMADRVEVIRGPATLLYGSGAVGGVINIIDGRIPEELVAGPEFAIEQSHNTVNGENHTIVRFDASAGNVAFHLDAFRRDNDNVEIPGFAVNEAGLEAVEDLMAALHGDEHDEHDEDRAEEEHGHDEDHDHDEEFENTNGFIGNSNSESDGATAGFSFVGERGFFGVSAQRLTNNYGLPPGTHSHAHGDEHGEEEHSEEEHGEEEHEGEEHGEEGHDHGDVEFVRLDMEKTRYDIKGRYDFDGGFFQSFEGSLGFTDYTHSEVEFFEDGDVEIGTRFANEGMEGRFTLSHTESESRSGVWGVQLTDTDFSAIGEEAFIPESRIESLGIFAVERLQSGRYTGELGLRFEQGEVSTGNGCSNDDNALSVSASGLYAVDGESNVMLGLSRSQRTPTVEELYSNVDPSTCANYADPEQFTLHAATNLLEIGNTSLDEETSTNIEVGYRRFAGPFIGQFSVYRNQIDDYVFLDITGEEFEEQLIARYTAADATFTGLEGEVSVNLLETGTTVLDLTVFGDLVRAELDNGGNVPRIPHAKIGAELRFSGSDWSMHAHVTRAADQDDVGATELPTDGYTMVSLYGDYHWRFGSDSELKLFARADNVLDEEIRLHQSLLKNYAPEPGRGVTLGLRFTY